MNRAYFAQRAHSLKPELKHKTVSPASRVNILRDESTFIGYAAAEDHSPIFGTPMRSGDSLTLDFGSHMVGYVTLKLALAGTRQDAPARIRLTFAEMPDEIGMDEGAYNGWLSPAWLQTEVVTIDSLPGEIRLPRRYAFRYLKMEVVATSLRFGVTLEDASCDSVTSAGDIGLPLPDGMAGRIAEVSLRTLKNCMQYFFEDGPKRDRRLWIGDLRLQALTSHVTFKNTDLVRRCLYMIAAAQLPSGWLPAAVYDTDPPTDDETVMVDYALLFCATLRDLIRHCGDLEIAGELFPVCIRQAELAHERLNADGTFTLREGECFFIDWKDDLHKDAASLGSYLYGLKAVLEIAESLDKSEDAGRLRSWIEEGRTIARSAYWNSECQRFVSGGQISMASQIWMALGGASTDAKKLLTAVLSDPPRVNVGTPYLKHYLVEALWNLDMKAEAIKVIFEYWGAMIQHGADTFWEVFIPDMPEASPYGHRLIHSRCHAWSCTPAYFLVQHGEK